MDVESLVLDSPRIGHELPDLSSVQPRDNGLEAAFQSGSQDNSHDISQKVSCAGAASSPTADASRASAEPAGVGPVPSQIKDENGQLEGNGGVGSERATEADVEIDPGVVMEGSGLQVWVRTTAPALSEHVHVEKKIVSSPAYILIEACLMPW